LLIDQGTDVVQWCVNVYWRPTDTYGKQLLPR